MSERVSQSASTTDNVPEMVPSDDAYCSEADYKLKMYYEWLNECHQAELEVRAGYAKNPGYPAAKKAPWEVDGLTDEQRQQEQTRIPLEKFFADGKEFSPAAHMLVTSHESAQFFDDIKCAYLGDSQHLGWFREISPAHNDTGFAVDFKYDVGVLNAYTDSGTIIHIRETLDSRATTREQKLFIVAMNLLTREVKRLYADDSTHATPLKAASVERQPANEVATDSDEAATADVVYLTPADSDEAPLLDEKSAVILPPLNLAPYQRRPLALSGADEIINLKPHKFSSYNGQANHDDTNPFSGVFQRLSDANADALQPKLKKAAAGYWAYKEEGRTEYGALHTIKDLDMQRQLLGQVALAEGIALDERGVVIIDTLPQFRTA
ncbi:MAG TPA: hypothetical protein VFM68_03290 [Candidatus Saccharimonadales bacterium]|nr:hypothetical protein [Candidatus Saccharimonadales bacterium]